MLGKRESYFVCYRLLVIMWVVFEEVSSSSGHLGLSPLSYCGTPLAFHISININIYMLRRHSHY